MRRVLKFISYFDLSELLIIAHCSSFIMHEQYLQGCSTTTACVRVWCVRFKLRILDVFGTEAIYNDNEYVKSHSELQYKASWGRLGVRLKQFYTLYRMYSTLSLILLQFSTCTARQQVIWPHGTVLQGRTGTAGLPFWPYRQEQTVSKSFL